MQRFDCLAVDCPLLGPHLLEASAGTGKTFSIEHIYIRLILEGLPVEQILVVTFTRAATRELKGRIRANLENALSYLQHGEHPWGYLETYQNSEEARGRLKDAIALFDRCQIFTIHSFCSRMLREFAFEAKTGLSIPDPDQEKKIPEPLKHALQDFLEYGVDETLLCLEQAGIICREFDSWEKMSNRLLTLEKAQGTSFSELFEQCKAALHKWKGGSIEEGKLLEDFRNLAPGYKAVKGDLENQVKALALLNSGDVRGLRILIKERASLFDFIHPRNKKVKAPPSPLLNYSGFFDWAREALVPFLDQSGRKLIKVLQAAWAPIAEKIIAEEEYYNPDEILLQMKRSLVNGDFASQVRQKYSAVIIDEFQDTDETQWEIFTSLFLENEELKALYLVGDPKQSIYRFRKADVYTYLQARDRLGEEALYQLDTNFRSSKQLLGALNALFSRNWLHLPKANRVLPYYPVKAGLDLDSNFSDGKGAVHFFEAIGEGKSLFEAVFLPFVAGEIERLLPECKSLGSFAVLVKDRYQAEQTLQFLQSRGLPAIAKSHIPLGQTVAFQAVREVFDAVLSSERESFLRIVQSGPFAIDGDLSLAELKRILEKGGLVPFCRALLKEKQLEPSIYRDTLQIFEALFAWERREGYSSEGLKRFLVRFKNLSADEGARRLMEAEEDAIQIMTLHISKGLEFEIVFALGLASRTPAADDEKEEIDAEKLRQLYVAMTRAKKRLYIPFIAEQEESEPGTHSPMELFSRFFGKDELRSLAERESITFEHLTDLYPLPPPKIRFEPKRVEEAKSPRIFFTPSRLLSFTSLAQTSEPEVKLVAPIPDGYTLNTMPRGAETGVIIHQIFESVFSSKIAIWKDRKALEALVAEEVQFSPLSSWKGAIVEMVQQTITAPLIANGEFFTLAELNVKELQVEMEFLFSTEPHFVKGFIDLVFKHRGKYYILDWKTNWLDEYTESSMQKAMKVHDYELQAAIYAESLRRYLGVRDRFTDLFGGAFYFFVRGNAPYHLTPDFSLLNGRYARPQFD
jgi:exodeoxyribonuclease V beta subunit